MTKAKALQQASQASWARATQVSEKLSITKQQARKALKLLRNTEGFPVNPDSWDDAMVNHVYHLLGMDPTRTKAEKERAKAPAEPQDETGEAARPFTRRRRGRVTIKHGEVLIKGPWREVRALLDRIYKGGDD